MRHVLLIGFLHCCFLHAQNGALKPDFGMAGKMSLDIDDLDNLTGFVKDDQEHTYFYGSTSDNQGGIYPFDFFVGKMDAYGNIDSSFGNNGISRHDFPGFEISSLQKAVYHSTGIYFLGQGINGTSLDTFALFVGKINLDGSIDSTFATDGFFTSEFLGTYNTAGSLIIDNNDKLVFCGSTTDDQGFLVEFPLLGRLNLNGTPDSTLGNTGLIVYDYYQDTMLDAMNIPSYQVRHGDGAYLSEIVEYNNAYFVTGEFKGTAHYQLHIMSITKDGQINPNFISSGPFIFQIDPGANHFLHDIAFDGETFYLGFESQSTYDGYHQVQMIDTSGTIGSLVQVSDSQYDMRTNFIEFWNGRLFVGGYHLDYMNTAPGYHSDDTKIYCFDDQMNQVMGFNFLENMGTDDEQGAEDLIFHQNFGLVGGYMNNLVGDNVTDLYFMAFEVNNELSLHTNATDFVCYPNPAQSYLFFNQHISDFQIYALSGEIVLNGENTIVCDISMLSSGTYILRTSNQYFKFIKE